ncbi:MAG: hypothetical protein MJ096_02245 [Clostridia bacterium]|nr:hypothetical protein [Clostridia bacterium]
MTTEQQALGLLQPRLSAAVLKASSLCGGEFNEIRLRLNGPLCLTVSGKTVNCGVICTREDMDSVVRRLCGNSLYSHGDTIKEGYIASAHGIRAGICGRAVTDGGSVSAVTDVSSLCLRIPRRVRGAGDEAYAVLEKGGFSSGLLIYSRPGVGKTTLLRELAVRLAGGARPFRVAVIDTRCELAAGLDGMISADVLTGYPRGKGIEIAVRTLSPEFIICDEIGTREDAEAIRGAAGSGVRFVASAHAGSSRELFLSPIVGGLAETGVFGAYLGLLGRTKNGYVTELTFKKEHAAAAV